MRVKDAHKEEALHRATVELVNEIGFVSSSMSKIARKAGVSPATIYTYFENKDDLLTSTYMEIMERMSAVIFKGLESDRPVYDVLHGIWRNTFEYVYHNRADYLYTEQFSKSPYAHRVDHEDIKRFFAPMIAAIRRGVDEKILKDVHLHLHVMFFFYPILTLANPGCSHTVPLDEELVETSFQLAWDAIRR